MYKTIAFRTRSYNKALKYTDIRSYLFTLVFILLSVGTPWIFHQFHLAGATFLPMHIFIMVAGLLFGWRAGLIVGIFSPLVSYAISGMPALTILPQITIELSVYGITAGILRERLNLRAIWALLGAMIAGRIALLLSMLSIYLITGASYSPLGLEINPFTAFWSVIMQGWPGIVIQLVLIPIIVLITGKFLRNN